MKSNLAIAVFILVTSLVSLLFGYKLRTWGEGELLEECGEKIDQLKENLKESMNTTDTCQDQCNELVEANKEMLQIANNLKHALESSIEYEKKQKEQEKEAGEIDRGANGTK